MPASFPDWGENTLALARLANLVGWSFGGPSEASVIVERVEEVLASKDRWIERLEQRDRLSQHDLGRADAALLKIARLVGFNEPFDPREYPMLVQSIELLVESQRDLAAQLAEIRLPASSSLPNTCLGCGHAKHRGGCLVPRCTCWA